ncbi:MAG: T9SS type A sorting domain-containing protein, partial [Bacteroidia bacterium]
VTGEQPAQPTLACYEEANFNTTSCEWDVTGEQPAMPTLACYEEANFNTQSCEWDVAGEMPIEPATECYEVASFNTETCVWDVTGEPNEVISSVITECDSYTWDVNGVTYTESGIYTYSEGCQDYELDLTINESSAITFISETINEGESFEFDGNFLTEAGEYTAYFQNAALCDSTVILTLTVNPIVVDGCLAAQVVSFNQGFRKDGDAVRPERSIPTRVLGAPDAQNPSVYAAEQFFFSLGFGGTIEIDFGYNIANGPGNDLKIWESSASPNAEQARIEVSQDGLGYVPVGTVSQGGEVDFGGVYSDYIRFVRIVDISNPAQFSNNDVTDGYDVDAVECIHGRYVQPSCVGVEVFSVSQGKQANGDDVSADRSIIANALDLPVAAPVGTVDFYALGFGGEITLAFAGPVANGPGADVRIVETTWNFTAAEYPETANVFASQDGINFVFLGSTVHSGDFDLGPLTWAQYIKIMDASDASLFPANADGYDLNGIECLNGSPENPGDDGLVPCSLQNLLSYNPGTQKNGDPIHGLRNDPTKALGEPQGNDTYNFVSLGFGGSIELGFDFVVFNNDGNDIQVIETSFGNPTCDNYPEHAEVEGSIDGVSWINLGELCLDGTLDISPMTFLQFVRITDVSNMSSNRFGGSADGFDVDAVLALGPCFQSTARYAFTDNTTTPDESAQMSIYPNPADDFTVVRLEGISLGEKIQIEIYDAAGRIISSENHVSIGNETNIRLNINDYSVGVYSIVVTSNNNRFVQRMVK